MEFYERGGGAMARLDWASPSRLREVIPATRLGSFYPAHTGVPQLPTAALQFSTLVPNPFPAATGMRFRLPSDAPTRLAAGCSTETRTLVLVP